MLLVLRNVSFEGVKIGAMGTTAHGVSVDSYDAVNSSAGLKQLLLNQDIYAKKRTTFLLVVKSGEMINATKSGFLKIFNSDKNNIETYLKLNKINFNRQQDLERLFYFCTQSKT